MKLAEAIDIICGRTDDMKIAFARKPWTLESDAEVREFVPDVGVPKDLKDRGYSYFLESSVAQEVLEVFESKEPTPEQRRELVMYYAENDAFPDWVYNSRDT